ncbi:hypothetical protein JCM5350_007037 [Sporobolomyces pararoseus]
MDVADTSTSGKDYLSRLPNEIIQDIFDRSFSFVYPYGALSRKLLPFYERTLYSNLFIRNSKSFTRLLGTLEAQPSLGRLVESLEIMDCSDHYVIPQQQVDRSEAQLRLLSILPNLRNFNTTWYLSLSPRLATTTLSNTLRLVDVPIVKTQGSRVDLAQAFEWISALPSVEDLHFSNWHLDVIIHQSPVDFSFPSVKCLSISGQGATNPDVSVVINACPLLEDLSLFEEPRTGGRGGGAVSFQKIFSSIQTAYTTLTTLSLFSTMSNTIVGAALANFLNLRHLSLDDVGRLPELHQSVLKLVNLVEFIIGCQDYEWNSLLELVQGRSRLLNLEHLSLNQIRLRRGRRFDPDDSAQLSQFVLKKEEDQLEEEEEEGEYLYLLGWHTRGISLLGPQYWTEFDNFVQIARGAGIRLSGSVFDSRDVFLSSLLEFNNLVVAEAFFNNDFNNLVETRVEGLRNGLNLPPLGNTSEDPRKLELVKVPLPELEWFALTLTDKEVESGTEGHK